MLTISLIHMQLYYLQNKKYIFVPCLLYMYYRDKNHGKQFFPIIINNQRYVQSQSIIRSKLTTKDKPCTLDNTSIK